MDNKDFHRYSNICFICNVAVMILMSAATAVILYLFGIDLTICIIAAFVLFWLYAWIEERLISKHINMIIEGGGMLFFSKSKNNKEKKKEDIIIENPVFGKLKYIYTWWSYDRIDLTMFGKNYSASYSVASDEQKDVPNGIQEEAFKRFLSKKEKLQKEAERVVSEAIPLGRSLEIGEVIRVGRVCFSRDGKCGIEMEIADDYLDEIDLDELDITPGPNFGVSLFPELYIIKSCDAFEDLFS